MVQQLFEIRVAFAVRVTGPVQRICATAVRFASPTPAALLGVSAASIHDQNTPWFELRHGGA